MSSIDSFAWDFSFVGMAIVGRTPVEVPTTWAVMVEVGTGRDVYGRPGDSTMAPVFQCDEDGRAFYVRPLVSAVTQRSSEVGPDSRELALEGGVLQLEFTVRTISGASKRAALEEIVGSEETSRS
jgi:hypothetical protein